MSLERVTAELKAAAYRLGFGLVGVCPAVTPRGLHQFYDWMAAGYAGQMLYFANRQAAYAHPSSILSGARSLVMLGLSYRTVDPVPCGAGEGRVSRYAWNDDYHDVIRERLTELSVVLKRLVSGTAVRGVVDSAPLLEREFAQLAGLGWIGKNTLLLNKHLGSWFFLAALVTDAELAYDQPFESDHCGTCRACLDACPTGAFDDAWRLDPRKCISYLTIELRGAVPTELREPMGDWLFGCDVCQDVCPWNDRAPQSPDEAFAPADGMNPLPLAGLFRMSDEDFRRRFRQTPLWRPRRRGLLRSAAIVLGNRPFPAAVDALTLGLADSEALVRGAAAWALARQAGPAARAALVRRLAIEPDENVRAEIATGLAS